MKKSHIAVSLLIIMIMSFPAQSNAAGTQGLPQEDSKILLYQDMLMLFLGPKIDAAVAGYYAKTLSAAPTVYPYQIDVVQAKRLGGFRQFHFMIELEVTPTIGPHITVGKDRLTFEVAPTIHGTGKLVKFEHLETHALPPNWQHLMK
ncbi:DUF3888 domain-containing protein [Paenibacillus sp. MER TA 81-3]|uniref:DUF3888 domain-containing protein n=1 Tax=Paenibacillus sp. MER TA 81-3 TaxID=2939573 RepID=UPI00203F1750|nr:DUF3888 domain-containing protein [Paenibacillus sp. MER TA 81-3]MCM3340333.1 DUF3888 domain-containing protein [Paenibacillus sp. MER TA 81-3]